MSSPHVYQVRFTKRTESDHVVRFDSAAAVAIVLNIYPTEPWTLWECSIAGDRMVYEHRPCACGNEDVMRDLGMACSVSCGADKYPTEVER